MRGSRIVARNVISTLATQIISWLMTYTVMLYLPTYLGVDAFGKLAFAGSFVGVLGVLVPLGTSNVLIRDIARDRSRTGELLLASLVLRIPLGLVMTVFAVLIGRLFHYPALTQSFILALAIGMTLAAANDALLVALQGQENIPRQSIAIIIEKFLSSALTIGLIFYRAPLWTLAAVGLFTAIPSILINISAFKSLIPSLQWPTKATIRYVITAGIPFAGWLIFRTLYGQTDPIVLKLVTNDKTVGWYAAAFRLICSTLILPGALCGALLPTLARLYRDEIEEFQKLAHRMLELIILCAIPITVLFIFLPNRIIALMHYPHEFYGSLPVLQIGGIGVFLYYVASVVGTVVVASDRQNGMLRTSILATLIGIPLCFLGSIVTHRLWGNGAIGAIFSDVLLEMYLIASYLTMLPKNTFRPEIISLIGRSLLASLPMVLFLCLTCRSGVGLWAFVACIPIYLFICWLLRCFDPQYLLMARNMLTRTAKA